MLKFTAAEQGRLAKLVAAEGVPYQTVRKLLRAKDIKLNGKRVNADLTCEKGDLIEVYIKDGKLSERIPAPVYNDGNLLALNKRAGISCEDFYKSVLKEYPAARAVHRLDRNTCGLILYALNKTAEDELLFGFKHRTFEKFYLAEVIGAPEPSAATLTAYLGKDEKNSTVYVHATRQNGDVEIKTAYNTLKRGKITSVLQVELLTGRTHQIRAHLKFIGHPIVGDGKYGDAAFNKKVNAKYQLLQAQRIILHFGENSPMYYLNGKEISVPAEIGV